MQFCFAGEFLHIQTAVTVEGQERITGKRIFIDIGRILVKNGFLHVEAIGKAEGCQSGIAVEFNSCYVAAVGKGILRNFPQGCRKNHSANGKTALESVRLNGTDTLLQFDVFQFRTKGKGILPDTFHFGRNGNGGQRLTIGKGSLFKCFQLARQGDVIEYGTSLESPFSNGNDRFRQTNRCQLSAL